jgi:hypothetical protein
MWKILGFILIFVFGATRAQGVIQLPNNGTLGERFFNMQPSMQRFYRVFVLWVDYLGQT